MPVYMKTNNDCDFLKMTGRTTNLRTENEDIKGMNGFCLLRSTIKCKGTK